MLAVCTPSDTARRRHRYGKGTQESDRMRNVVFLLVVVFGIVQMFSTEREPPPPRPPVSVPVVEAPHQLASNVLPPAFAPTARKEKPANESRPDPNAKKPSMPRARVLFTAARNLDNAGKTEGAIVFYRSLRLRLAIPARHAKLASEGALLL
jgi:hypothetical protein